MAASCVNMVAQYKPPHAFDADLDIIRKRIIDDLLQPNVAPDNIRQLATTIKPDGSWPETTRPANQESYAQRISTTSWALLALLQ